MRFDEYETLKYGPCSFFLNVFSVLEETLPDFNFEEEMTKFLPLCKMV